METTYVEALREQLCAAQERAEELAKANEALQRSLTSLTSADDLQSFLVTVMQEAIHASDAVTAGVFVHDPSNNTLDLIRAIVQKEVIDIAIDPRVQMWRSIPTDFSGIWEQLQNGEVFWHGLDNPPPEVTDFILSWHQQMGHKVLAWIPMMLKHQVLGLLGLAFANEPQATESKLEQCRVLAQHAALALQISRLSEEARQVAIAREQEKAAQERVSELITVNQALQRSLTTLTNANSLQSFLRTVLQQTIYASGAVSAAVFVHDDVSNTLPMVELVLQGEIIDVQTDSRAEVWRTDQAFSYDYWRQMVQEEQILWYDLEDLPFEISPAILDWHQRMGNEVLVWIPMFLQHQALGFLGLAFHKHAQPTESKLEQCRILAQHAALALQTSRLSEEAKQFAIVREQEKAAQERAAELTKTNAALQRSLTSLARSKSLQTFLPTVLQEAMDMSGATSAAVFVYAPATDSFYLAAMRLWGEMVDVKTDPRVAFWQFIPEDTTATWKQMIQSEQIFWFTLETPSPDWDYNANWHLQMGHQGSCAIPMLIDGQVIGNLGLAFAQPEQPAPGKLERCRFFAHQIALALYLSRLSEEAQQVAEARLNEAIAREQEKAAQERTDELAKANQSLQRTIGYLNENPNLQAFLHAVMQEAMTASDAIGSAIFTYDAVSHTLQNTSGILQGDVIDIATDPRTELWRIPLPADITPAWEKLCKGDILWLDNENPSPEHWLDSIPWHRQFGHRTLVCLPLSAGNQPLGFLSLAFSTPPTLEASKLAQCRALSQQIALALRLDSLSQQATQSALLEERNRLAGEIHDTLAQSFTGINFQVNLAKRIAQHHPEEAQQIYDRIAQLAQNGLAEARRSVWSLYSAREVYETLEPDLRRSVATILGASSPIQVSLTTSGVAYALPETLGKNLLRIGQEAITNTLKHAQASAIEIEILYQAHQICLQVKDNGCGFVLQGEHAGFGLIGMAERAERMNGKLTITTALQEGTSILIQVPLTSRG